MVELLSLSDASDDPRLERSHTESQAMYLKVMAESVCEQLNTWRQPGTRQWHDEKWLTRLYDLAKSGVELRQFQYWTIYVATRGCTSMLTRDEIEERLQEIEAVPVPAPMPEPKYRRALHQENYSVEGVRLLLGSSRPSRVKWATESWTRRLYLVSELGVELPVFMQWAMTAWHANRKEVRIVEELPGDAPEIRFVRRPPGIPSMVACRCALCKRKRGERSDSDDEEVTGPPKKILRGYGVPLMRAPRTIILLDSDDEAESRFAR